MGHKTEGRAKYEIVNMMLNSASLTSTKMQRIVLLFLYVHIRTEQHSINMPCLMLYQSRCVLQHGFVTNASFNLP